MEEYPKNNRTSCFAATFLYFGKKKYIMYSIVGNDLLSLGGEVEQAVPHIVCCFCRRAPNTVAGKAKHYER